MSDPSIHSRKVVGQMASPLVFRVTLPLVAVTQRNPNFLTIPAGAIIETTSDLAEPGLHVVSFRGSDVLAFARDILERSERLSAAAGD